MVMRYVTIHWPTEKKQKNFSRLKQNEVSNRTRLIGAERDIHLYYVFSSSLICCHRFLALFAWHRFLNVFACHNFKPKFHYYWHEHCSFELCASFLYDLKQMEAMYKYIKKSNETWTLFEWISARPIKLNHLFVLIAWAHTKFGKCPTNLIDTRTHTLELVCKQTVVHYFFDMNCSCVCVGERNRKCKKI